MRLLLFLIGCITSLCVSGQIVIGEQFGRDASGKITTIPIGSKAQSTSSALAANATWTSDTLWYNGNNNIQLAIQTDVAGAYLVEYFMRNGNKIPFMGVTTSFDPAIVTAFQAAIAGKGDGVRITYVNGPIAQTSFYLEIGLLNNTIQQTLRSVGTTITSSNLAGVNHVVGEGRDSSNSAQYRQVTTTYDANKKKVAWDVNLVNRGDTQRVIVTNQTTGNSTSALQSTGNTSLANIDTDLGALTDAQATNSTASNSVIAILKGMLQRPSSCNVLSVTTSAASSVVLAANPLRKSIKFFSVSGTINLVPAATATVATSAIRVITNSGETVENGYTGQWSAIGAGQLVIWEFY
jgi:hypothetical protein